VNTVLTEYGLPKVSSVGDLFISDLTMVVGIPELDPLPDTANPIYIGPVLWQKSESKIPEWIARLKADRPVVWVYPGNLQYMKGLRTFGDSAVVLQACIEALANNDMQVVLTTGHHALPRSFRPLPSNFRHEPFVPGLAMAEKSDLLIHHGGYGSCQTGLYTGTPAVIIPTISERESTARRIAAQGAAELVIPVCDTSGRKKTVQPEELASKVKLVLSTPSYKENAERIKARLKEYGGVTEAARRIEELLHTSQ
jgi:MGT family glycosyltransferase